MKRVRVAICADFREEGWPSMDRVAERLLAALAAGHADAIDASLVRPAFVRRASRVLGGAAARNLDRGMNRLVDYPRHVAGLGASHDVFHVVDHSYSQLVRRLPPGRAVVTCHDLDTFRSVLAPADDPRSPPFRAMTRYILGGMRRAAWVTCDTAAVRDEVLAHGLTQADRVLVAPIGVGAEFQPEPDADADRRAGELVAAPAGAIEVLHVGSTASRKRLDRVLRLAADLTGEMDRVHLVRVGGPFTAEQTGMIRELGIGDRVSVLPPLDDRLLAAVYRRAAVTVLPSDREGFGLPVVEALASGTPVVASDLPALREVGGPAVAFCAPGDRLAWAATARRLILERRQNRDAFAARRAGGIAWAGRYTWTRFAAQLANVYLDLAGVSMADRARGSEPCPV